MSTTPNRAPGLLATAAVLLLGLVSGRAQQTKAATQPAQRLDPLTQRVVSEISEERISNILRKMESFETRNTLSDPSQTNRGIGVARQWIFDQFKSYSPRLEVNFDTHQIPKGGRVWKDIELRNVVAILPGKMPQATNRWILVSGHYDSLNLKDAVALRGQPEKAAELFAPGVSDDASGTACAMECARVFSQFEFDATLVFVAFAGEEQGLVGARAMAKRLKGQQQEIEAVLNNDIIGNEVSGNGERCQPRAAILRRPERFSLATACPLRSLSPPLTIIPT
jgi:acetylornithine deacetylase/succinyl-diaminopimelate desuccinylase-like protein